MHKAIIALGSNMGDRLDLLAKARAQIDSRCGKLIKKSSIFETEAWGFESEDAFLNQVVEIETSLLPNELLQQLLEIEKKMGRQRRKDGVYTSRPIDLDIIFMDQLIINRKDLIIPHPRMHLRKFVLAPLNEIAPDSKHPLIKKSVSNLLALCKDRQKVVKYS